MVNKPHFPTVEERASNSIIVDGKLHRFTSSSEKTLAIYLELDRREIVLEALAEAQKEATICTDPEDLKWELLNWQTALAEILGVPYE